MSEPLDQLRLTLRANDVSVTKARQVVFQTLMDSEPQTMQQVVFRCANETDRATVYRTIALFEQLGIVQRLQIGWKYKLELTDSFIHHHHHLSCVRCGQIIPLPEDADIENRLLVLAKTQDFLPQDHQLEIRGLCANCRHKDKN